LRKGGDINGSQYLVGEWNTHLSCYNSRRAASLYIAFLFL